MRLEITRRTDLATRALLHLSAVEGRVKASVLAEQLGTTPGFLSQAMTPLVGRGWVRSVPGPTGGYELTADPAAISVLEVIESVEGPTDTGRCVLEDRNCAVGGQCALHRAWATARSHLLDDLGATPLSALVGARR
jgi:Rrf2 family protein